MAAATGLTESRFPTLEAERIPLLDDSHVAMRVNLDACIQCGLCVRACREVQVNDVIGMAGRGHDSFPVFDHFNDNLTIIADSNHGWKMIGVGHLIADEVLGETQDLLEPFRFGRFAEGELHPVSHSPYPWS